MSCDCNDPDKLSDPDHVPCTPCGQMAKAIMSVTPPHTFHGVGAAQDDLTTIQQFLQTLTSGVAPTATELATAQAAATALSADVFAAQKSSAPPAGTMNVKTTAIVLGSIAAVLGGASLAYLYKTEPTRRRRTR